jgi:hypothetical protein
MIEEMKLRNFSPRTEPSYVAAMVGLIEHYHRSLDQSSFKMRLECIPGLARLRATMPAADSCWAFDKGLFPCPVLADTPRRSPRVLPTAFDARLSDLRYEPSDGWVTSPCCAGSSQLARLICLRPQARGMPLSPRVFASGFFEVVSPTNCPLPLATLRLRLAGSGL